MLHASVGVKTGVECGGGVVDEFGGMRKDGVRWSGGGSRGGL